MEHEAEAVLITGLYGSGKSSVAAEMADILERHDVRFAAIDLDWLAWANVGTDDGHGPIGNPLMLPNLTAVVANDVGAGVSKFVLAGTIHSVDEVEAIRAVLGMPLRVVRLTVPMPVIELRLRSDPTSGRADDLEVARRAAAVGEGEGVEDLVVDNDRPIREVASEIVTWLGWH